MVIGKDIKNSRSMAPGSIIPLVAYDNVPEAAAWLCEAFGFGKRLQIGNHQLSYGDGSLVVTERTDRQTDGGHPIMVRVDDVDAHCKQAKRSGAKILSLPTDYPYGERQYTAEDLAGHRWTFSQSVEDVDPADWGGIVY